MNSKSLAVELIFLIGRLLKPQMAMGDVQDDIFSY